MQSIGWFTRRVPPVEQEMLTLPEHLSSPPVLVGSVLFNLLFSVWCFVDYCLSFYPFSVVHCVFCSSIYELWLPLWYPHNDITITGGLCTNNRQQCKKVNSRDDTNKFLTKNNRFFKNNIFGEFVIAIYRKIKPTFHYLLKLEKFIARLYKYF